MNKISIIVPVYNTEKYIEKCVESLVNQKMEGVEVLLINDGSKDKSPQICDALQAKWPCVKVIHQKNQGVSAARNQGLQMATGEYIGFVDSDDYVELDMFPKMVDIFEREQEIDLVGCKFFESKALPNLAPVNTLSHMQIIRACCTETMGGFVCNKVFKREIIQKHNIRFNTNIGVLEDYIFCLDYAKYCSQGILFNQPLYHYVYRADSVTKQGFNKERFSGLKAYEIIIKHDCVVQSPKLVEHIQNDYVKYSLWLAKAVVQTKLPEERKYIKDIKQLIKSYGSQFMRNPQNGIKYKLGMIILYIYPKGFRVLK